MKQLELPTECIIGPCRLSYAHLFEPRANPQKAGTPLEYSVVCLIPKAPHEHLPNPMEETRLIAGVILRALDDKFKTRPPVWRNAMLDGDKEINKSSGKPQYPGFWYVSALNDQTHPPVLLDKDRNDIRKTCTEADWCSGDWARVRINFYGFDSRGNRGVSASLRAVQFLHKDEPFGGGGRSASSMAEEFGD